MEKLQKPYDMTRMTLLRSSNKLYAAAIAALFTVHLSAQDKVGSFEEYRKQYQDVNELVISDKDSYDIFIDGDKLRVLKNNYYESMVLSQNGIQNNEESFSYSDLIKLNEYEAYSIVNDKGKERRIKVTQTNEKSSRQSFVFHDDVKERQLIYPNLEPGARKVYSVETEYLDPFLLQSFIFGSGLPMINSTLEVRTDKDINIGYRIFNDPDNAIEFTKTEKKGKFIYQWTLKNIKPVKIESNSPGVRHFIPHINIFIKDYTINQKTVNVLDDTDKLYDYYKGFIKNLNRKQDADLKQLITEITSGSDSDQEKVKKIFYWVKDNIKYIAFENGYEGFIPREASLVYERKFGDCKDMASIVSCMADYAGVKGVSVSWIGTRDIPYTYQELSTPAVDNHMIAVYNDNGNYIFLDATDRETRYGLPSSFIQGKEALISDGDAYKVITVPIVEASTNKTAEVVTMKLDKEKIIGTGSASFHGYSRSDILAQIGDATGKNRFDMIKSLVLKGNNKFNLKEYKEVNIADRDAPYQVDYSFELADYAMQVDKEMYINLFLDRVFENMAFEADRKVAADFDFLTEYNIRYELEVPQNYTVKYVPENFALDNGVMRADCKYANANGKISLAVTIATKKMMVEPKDFAEWNDTIKKLKTTYSQTLILTEK